MDKKRKKENLAVFCKNCGESWLYGWPKYEDLMDYFVGRKDFRGNKIISVKCNGCGSVWNIDDVVAFMVRNYLNL